MGLFDMFKKKAEPAAAAAPASISASAGADVLCSPVKGKVIKMADVPDTVNMNGDGFEGFVKADDVVKAGQPILKIDRAKIAAAGYKDCVVVAVSNTAEFADVELAVEAESAVAAGDVIVKVVRK